MLHRRVFGKLFVLRCLCRFSAGQLLLRPSSFGLRCWHNCSQSWQFFRTFAGTYILCFVDNSAAQHALTKGYSKDVSFTKVLGCFSRFLASKSVALSFHRVTSVTSSANVSDSVSREDWSLAAELGCQLEEFDFNEGYAWLSQVPRGPKGALPEVRPVRPQASRAESGGTARRSGVNRAVRTELENRQVRLTTCSISWHTKVLGTRKKSTVRQSEYLRYLQA